MGYALPIVRDFHLAEDVFQEASLIILRKGETLENESDFAPWARKVVRFEALNALRRQNKSPELLEPAILDLLEEAWGRNEDSERYAATLKECIEKLSPKAQRLLELRYVAGMPGNVLAEKLHQPANTIYVALSRIYRVLSACVKERLTSEG